jgi:Holliday junction resolvase
MNKNYISGRAAEYAVVKELRKQGAVVAQRSAGSHSPIDVFALMPNGRVRLIQVKKGESPLELEKLESLPCAVNISIELWRKTDGGWQVQLVH